MSYYLMVFAPDLAPLEHDAFLAWFDEQSKWDEDHSYDSPEVSTSSLRAWFFEIIETFPAMNGPFAPKEPPEDEASETDYSVGKSVIYAAFAWSKAEEAYETMFRLAEKHGVGFFDASSEKGEVWLPKNGKLTLAHSG